MKKISEMTPGEALTEQALAVFKRRLEQARKRPSKAPPPQKRYSMLSRICASTRAKSRRRRKTPKISRRLFAVSSTTANIPYPALCGKFARPIRRRNENV